MQDIQTEEKPLQPSTRYVLAIDLGSGGPKAAIVSDSGEVIASAEESIATQMLPNGGAEQDPEEWWNGAKKTAKKVIRESGVGHIEIDFHSCYRRSVETILHGLLK